MLATPRTGAGRPVGLGYSACGRVFSDTFAGIAPLSEPPYVAAQLIGGLAAIALLRELYPNVTPEEAAEVLLSHGDER
jgi:hypothetical protein